jgi:hypothetical protein
MRGFVREKCGSAKKVLTNRGGFWRLSVRHLGGKNHLLKSVQRKFALLQGFFSFLAGEE